MNQYSILVVEDDIPLQNAINQKLSISGFTVTNARSVEQALEILNTKPIDVIWLDHYLLGSKNGLELVFTLKSENSPFKQIPIFVVSNTAGADKVALYMRFGIEKFFIKSDNRLDNIIDAIKKSILHD